MFDLIIIETFCEKYNRDNTMLQISKFCAIATAEDNLPLLTLPASKLYKNLYASSTLKTSTAKIKTLQITSLPLQQRADDKAAHAISISNISRAHALI